MVIELIFGVYVLIAFLAMIPTCIEQQANRIEGVLQRSLSLLACLLWPLPLVAILVSVHYNSQDVEARLQS